MQIREENPLLDVAVGGHELLVASVHLFVYGLDGGGQQPVESQVVSFCIGEGGAAVDGGVVKNLHAPGMDVDLGARVMRLNGEVRGRHAYLLSSLRTWSP